MAHHISSQLLRQGSPLFAAAAGAAVCLSGGVADATSGNVAASNAGATQFVPPHPGVKLFGNLASFNIYGGATGYVHGAAGGLQIDRVIGGSDMYNVVAGFNVSGGTNFSGFAYLAPGQSNKYIPMQFANGGIRYGWVHCISSSRTLLRIDTWSFNSTGGAIKTLDESITNKKLPLSDGRVKLNWSNANEAGVARYEVQAKGADGAWAALDSDVPGAGSYAQTAAAGGTYRLHVENVDGSAREIAF